MGVWGQRKKGNRHSVNLHSVCSSETLISTVVRKRSADLFLPPPQQCSLCGPRALLRFAGNGRILLSLYSHGKGAFNWKQHWSWGSHRKPAGTKSYTGMQVFSLSHKLFHFHLFQSKAALVELWSKNLLWQGCLFKRIHMPQGLNPNCNNMNNVSMVATSPTEYSPRNWIISASVSPSQVFKGNSNAGPYS